MAKKVKKELDEEPSTDETEPPKRDKKKKKSKKEKEEELAAQAPKKTNTGDSATIKRMMDDAAISVILDDETEDGLAYEEDVGLSNLKLVVGFAGVGASVVSHIYPAPFPKNWLVLLLCCAWYFLMSGILQLILSFCELESILLLRGKDGEVGLNVSSHMPRFQEMYTLAITPLPKGSLGLATAPKFKPTMTSREVETSADGSQKQWPCNHFFSDDGTFAEEAFMEEVQQFVTEYEALHYKKRK